MWKFFAALFVLLAPGMASAQNRCPDYRYDAKTQVTASSTDLWDAKYLDLRAGGDQQLALCRNPIGNRWRRNFAGWVTVQPDVEFRYDKNRDDLALELRVVSECDSVLLINTGAKNWYYDDDDNGRGDAKIRLTRPSSGWYDIWVGTYGEANCDARLIFETFRR